MIPRIKGEDLARVIDIPGQRVAGIILRVAVDYGAVRRALHIVGKSANIDIVDLFKRKSVEDQNVLRHGRLDVDPLADLNGRFVRRRFDAIPFLRGRG